MNDVYGHCVFWFECILHFLTDVLSPYYTIFQFLVPIRTPTFVSLPFSTILKSLECIPVFYFADRRMDGQANRKKPL